MLPVPLSWCRPGPTPYERDSVRDGLYHILEQLGKSPAIPIIFIHFGRMGPYTIHALVLRSARREVIIRSMNSNLKLQPPSHCDPAHKEVSG